MTRIEKVIRHYVYIPYSPLIAPYWGWQAATYGAHGIIIEVYTDDGLVGYGETAGRESIFKHAEVGEYVVGKDANQISHLTQEMKLAGFSNQAISGIEMALWDLLGKRCDKPLYEIFGGKVRDDVPLCGLMGIKPPDEAVKTAEIYKKQFGFTSIKTKAGRDPIEDLAIARALYEYFGDSIKLRLDANQSYKPDEFLDLCKKLEPFECIEYFEQPVHDRDIGSLKLIRQNTTISIALNESVTDAKSVYRIGRLEAASYLVPDIPDAGGITEVIAISHLAEALGLQCAFHCWHDLGVKTAAIAHIVSSQHAFSLAGDTTLFGLENDIITQPFVVNNGKINVPEKPGLGIEINFDMINKYKKKIID